MIAAIGDIHGCFCELRELLQYIKSKNPELTVFIGDYIDRGPDVKSVIDLIIKYSETNKTVFLYGNHEDMAIDAIYCQERYKKDHWFTQGGLETVSSLTGKK
ncbi:MAG TPA: metallophosphoesterase, partial [Tepiditoga sp.]|nr:metallophosphoesterase [Tepiditoga sp.]